MDTDRHYCLHMVTWKLIKYANYLSIYVRHCNNSPAFILVQIWLNWTFETFLEMRLLLLWFSQNHYFFASSFKAAPHPSWPLLLLFPTLPLSLFISCVKEVEASDRNVCQKNGRFRPVRSSTVFSLIKATIVFYFFFKWPNSNGYNGALWKGQKKMSFEGNTSLKLGWSAWTELVDSASHLSPDSHQDFFVSDFLLQTCEATMRW